MVQVYSHISPSLGQTEVDTWAYWHNSLVDQAAAGANRSRTSEFKQLWEKCFGDLQRARQLHETIATLIVTTGKLADRGTKKPAELASLPRHVPPTQNSEQGRVPVIPQATAEKFGFEVTARLHSWWLSSGDKSMRSTGSLQWISFLQLFIDFQLATGGPGPILVNGKWRFRATIEAGDFTYIQLCKWFQMLLKHYWKGNAINVGAKSTRPSSPSIGCWLVSAHLLWDSVRLQKVDEIISQQQGGLLKLGKHIEDMFVIPADPNFQVREPTRGLRQGM